MPELHVVQFEHLTGIQKTQVQILAGSFFGKHSWGVVKVLLV